MLDSTTAGALLNALHNGADVNDVADLYREFNTQEGGPTPEAIAWYNENKNRMVRIKGTEWTGEVVGLNEADSGIYNGKRFPIFLKQTHSGKTYEYQLDQLTLI